MKHTASTKVQPSSGPSAVREPRKGYDEHTAGLSKVSNADSKGRVVLGPRFAEKMFRITEQPDGNVLLEPVVTIHEREAWLFKNPDALAMVLKGIEESRAGEGRYLGSFAQYADIDIEDDDDE